MQTAFREDQETIAKLRKQLAAEKLANTILQKDSDEWKRRAEIMWRSLERIPGNALGVMYDDLPDDEPNWFEEDKNNG